MDDIISICLNELSLEGKRGCLLNRLWSLVEKRLVACPNMIFNRLESLNNHELESCALNTQQSKASGTLGSKSSNLSGFDLGMKNVILSLLKELHHITIKETEGFHDISTIEYHEKTRIMPSKELVKETLHLDKTNINWTDQLTAVYQKVLSSREEGITVIQLAREFQLDPRSCYHFVKTLLKANLCVKIPIVAHKANTNLVVHTLFCDTSPAYISFKAKEDVLNIDDTKSEEQANNVLANVKLHDRVKPSRKKLQVFVQNMLEKASNRALPYDFVVSTLQEKCDLVRKDVMGYIGNLVSFGYLKKINVQTSDQDGDFVSCIQLLKDLSSKQDDKFGDASKLIQSHRSFVKANIAIEAQIYNIIHACGEDGITSNELLSKVAPLSYKGMIKITEQLCGKGRKGQKAYIKSLIDSEGKKRISRYYSIRALTSSKKKTSANTTKETATTSTNVIATCKVCQNEIQSSSSALSARGFCSKKCETVSVTQDMTLERITSTKTSTSLTSVRRALYILELLYTHEILEFDVVFLDMMKQVAISNGEDLSADFRFDRKNVQRMLDTLFAEKKISLLNVNSKSWSKGMKKNRTIVTLPTIEPENPRIQEFLENAQHNILKGRTGKVFSKPVFVGKMDIDTIVAGENSDALNLDDHLRAAPLNKGPDIVNAPDVIDVDNELSGNEIATRYGFIHERAIRAKTLYYWLFEQSQATPNHIVSTGDVIEKYPFSLYLKTVGIIKENPTLKVIMENPSALEKEVVSSLSNPELQDLIRFYNFRRSFNNMVEHLETLGLVQAIEKTSDGYRVVPYQKNNHNLFKITRSVPAVVDFLNGALSHDQTILRSENDVEIHWEKIKESALSVPSGKKMSIPLKYRKFCLINWWKNEGLNVHQRKGLLKLVEAKTGNTPLSNLPLCYALSKRFELTLEEVIAFYKEYEGRVKGRIAREKAKLEKIATTSSSLQQMAGNPLVHTPLVQVPKLQGLRPTPLSFLRNKSLLENGGADLDLNFPDQTIGSTVKPDLNPIPDANIEFIRTAKKSTVKTGSQRRQYQWSEDDDEFMCHGFVVMSPYLKGKGVPSALSRKLVECEGMHPDAPRRRMKLLQTHAKYGEKIKQLFLMWPKFQKWAAEENKWFSVLNEKILQDCIRNVTSEFQKFCNSHSPSSAPSSNGEAEPSTPVKVKKEIPSYGLISDASIPIDDGLDKRTARSSKLAFLYGISFCERVADPKVADFDYSAAVTTESIKFNQLCSLIKRVLIIPDDEYSVEAGFDMLKGYSNKEMTAALNYLKECGAISKYQKSQNVADKRLPGRTLSLSDKITAILNGVLPREIFEKGQKYWNEVAALDHWAPPDLNDSGIMAVFTRLFSTEGQYLFVPSFPAVIDDTFSAVDDVKIEVRRKAGIEEHSSKKRKADDDQEGEDPPKVCRTNGNDMEVDQDTSKVISNMCRSESERHSTSQIFDIIQAGQECGKNIFEIQSALEASKENSLYSLSMNDLELIINRLEDGGLIVRVGFEHPRFVSLSFSSFWKMNDHLWVSSTGTIYPSVLKNLNEVLIGLIVQRPGITENNIHKRVGTLLTQIELRSLLNDLISRGVISKRTTSAPRPVQNLFDGLFSEESADRPESVITTYFPSTAWF